MAKRSLITGVSGFVGGYLAEHLLDCGGTVLGCGLVQPSAGRIDWVRWDLSEETGLDSESRGRIERFSPEVVYHLAGLSIPADCGEVEPTSEAVAVNVEGTRRVVEWAAAQRSRPRVLVISSSHVYASVSFESPVVAEDAPVGPAGGYGKTKLAAERVALDAARQRGLEVLVVRAFQHTGPGQNDRMMLPEWAGQVAELSSDKPIEVHTLDAWVDVTDARDVVRAYRLLAERGHSGTVYNVGSGIERRTGDLLEQLMQMADCRRAVVETYPGRKQDPIADIGRLVECTGWRTEIPIEKTLGDTLDYWRARKGGEH